MPTGFFSPTYQERADEAHVQGVNENSGTYLYCFALSKARLAKIGVARNVKTRLSTFRLSCPFDIEVRRAFLFRDIRVAHAWEAHLLAEANSWRGEWVVDDEKLASALSCVEADGEWSADMKPYQGRPKPNGADPTEVRIAKARMAEKFGVPASAKFPVDELGEVVATIRARLSFGFGAEDIAAMDGIPAVRVWDEVNALRESGEIFWVLGLPSQALEAAE